MCTPFFKTTDQSQSFKETTIKFLPNPPLFYFLKLKSDCISDASEWAEYKTSFRVLTPKQNLTMAHYLLQLEKHLT